MNADPNPQAEVVKAYETAGVRAPDGRQFVDLYLDLQSRGSDQARTTRRLRLSAAMLSDLLLSLSEAQEAQVPDDEVQRHLDAAELTPVQMQATGQPAFLLVLKQTNPAQARALPVRMLLMPSQVLGLADLFGAAVSEHGLRPPAGPSLVQ